MIQSLGHAGTHRRVAITVGAGFVPGTNAVTLGAAIAGGKLGWEMVGIRDGFEGLLHPERYPNGGLVALSPALIEDLDPATGGILGQAPWANPLHASRTIGDQPVEEADLSDELLRRLSEEDIDSLIAIVGVPGLSISMVTLSAVLNPKETAVPAMSFSIDRGMQTVCTPLKYSDCRMPKPGTPTMEIRLSMSSSPSLLNNSPERSTSSGGWSPLAARGCSGSIQGA